MQKMWVTLPLVVCEWFPLLPYLALSQMGVPLIKSELVPN